MANRLKAAGSVVPLDIPVYMHLFSTVDSDDCLATHRAFLHVNPEMRNVGRVEVAGGQTMSSLLPNRALPTKMSKVRAALVTHLAEAFSLERYHLHTGHPLLTELSAAETPRE